MKNLKTSVIANRFAPAATVPLPASDARLVAGMRAKRMHPGSGTLLLMCLPALIMLLLFHYLPLGGWLIAFFDYRPGLFLFRTDFVGFKWFGFALSEPELPAVLRNTLVLSGLTLLATPLPMLFAVFLSEMPSRRYRKIVQTTTTLPNFISWILVFALFYAFFSTSDGLVNRLLMKFGFIDRPLNPLGNLAIVWPLQTGLRIWKTLGFSAIVYLAAIASIDEELYDAAAVDGASRLQKIRYVVIPGLIPTYFTLLLLNIGNMIRLGFEQYYMFSNGLVQERIQVLDLYLYRLGLVLQNYPLSTALSMAQSLFSILLLMIANRLAKRIRGEFIF